MSTESMSSVAAPASYRLISSRSASIDSKRSSWFCMSSAERAAAGSKSSRLSYSRSAAMRTVVSGVRSSWETSDTNCRWTWESSSNWWIFSARLEAISLKEVARRARSSSPRTFSRSDSLPAARRSAAWRVSRTGVTTCRVTSEATAASRSTSVTPTTISHRWTMVRVYTSSVSGKKW